ncbi:MAG: hypothetical protein J0M24_22930 [Verrucomicrobia bacterium]|nr:hypothetical protein [Verrucomicrobiota bacterium]
MKSRILRFSQILLVAIGLSATSAGQTAMATLEPVGPATSLTNSFATAVSDDGQVVYGNARSPSFTRAFRWQPSTGLTWMRTLEGNRDESVVYATTADGSQAVGYLRNSNFERRPVWWSPQGPRLLPLIDGADGNGTAYDISADGRVILGKGVRAKDGDGYAGYALLWIDGQAPVKLYPLPLVEDGVAPQLSADGSTAVFGSGGWIMRWSSAVGVVPLRLSPAYPDSTPAIRSLALSSNGEILTGTAWEAMGAAPGRIFRWTGLTDGFPLPVRVADARSFSGLIMNGPGTLMAGSSAPGVTGQGWLIPAYGLLPFDGVLQAQGADLGPWKSVTNLAAMSPNGRWIVGSGIRRGSGEVPDRHQAFRAQITLNTDAKPVLRFEVLPTGTIRLRWPVTEVQVTVESVPLLNPAVPWVPETGVPAVDGTDIVLDLPGLPEGRLYRLQSVP